MTLLGRNSAAASPVRATRRVVMAAIGFSVLAFGVALLVLPGPAILVIPLGLAILATEFLWARKLLHKIRNLLRRLKARARRMRPHRLAVRSPRNRCRGQSPM